MRNTKEIHYKKGRHRIKAAVLALWLVCIILAFSGCGSVTHISIETENGTSYTEAALKADGRPFTIAVMDEEPPIESSYLWLKGLCERLQELGYIADSVNLSEAPEDYEGYFDYITSCDLGEKINIDSECYLLSEDNLDEVEQSLRYKTENGQIDLIAVTGTYPGTFLKELDLPVPFLVSFASDPVASGIIDSTEKTGDDDIWALVEPMAFARQLEIYHNITGFERLGIISTDKYDEEAGGAEIRARAEELGVTVIQETVAVDEMYSESAERALKDSVSRLVSSDIDALLVLFGVLDGSEADPSCIIPILKEEQITYLISDGESLVKDGGMLLISFYNYEGYGRHVADVCNAIFHGEKAGDQAIEYISSPKVVLNMSTAEELGYEVDYKFLQTVDTVYRNEMKN